MRVVRICGVASSFNSPLSKAPRIILNLSIDFFKKSVNSQIFSVGSSVVEGHRCGHCEDAAGHRRRLHLGRARPQPRRVTPGCNRGDIAIATEKILTKSYKNIQNLEMFLNVPKMLEYV